MGTENEKEQSGKDHKNELEWAVFAIGLLLVAGILGYLGYKIFTHQPSPPDLQVEYSSSPTETAPYRYHVVVKNNGGETAEEVSIELVLEGDSATIEKAELQLPFVPQASKREGWVNFSKNPDTADTIMTRVVSFKKP
jgi:uncharacterized protein (TIGR02588 family)